MSLVVSAARPSTTSAMACPTRSVAAVSGTRRHVRTSLWRVSWLIAGVWEWEAKLLVVDPVPATQRRVVPTVVPPMPATTPVKKITAKGKAPVRQTTRPRPRKVTWVPSLSPVVVEAPWPDLGVARPSAAPRPPLFEESIPLGGGEVGANVPVSLGE